MAEARTRSARMRGLAGLSGLGSEEGLLIERCRSVHTFGMGFALDLIWLDRGDAVVRVDHAVAPRRLRTCLRARSVVETASGASGAFLAAGVGAPPG